MTRIHFIGGGGPVNAISQIGSRADSGVATVDELTYNGPANYGAEDPLRRIFFLIVGSGVSTMISMTRSGTPLPLERWGGIVLARADRPTGSGGETFVLNFPNSNAKNLNIWALRTTGIRNPTPIGQGTNSLNGSAGNYEIGANARRGGLAIGGVVGSNASDFGISGIESTNGVWVSTNRRWGMWGHTPATETPFSVTVTQAGSAPNSNGVLWTFR